MSKPRERGFTLIELLTVIAIIAILVGITAAVLPQVMEKARITKTETTLKQLHTSLVTYQTDKGSLPPGYGYLIGFDDSDPPQPKFNHLPYTALIGVHREFALYDEYWANDYDFNGNNIIDLLEFQPVRRDKPLPALVFESNEFTLPYDGTNFPEQVAAMTIGGAEQPPFTYIPVNRAQADKFRTFCNKTGSEYAGRSAQQIAFFTAMAGSFPPPYYDDYVLVSRGPAGNIFGVIPPSVTPPSNGTFPPENLAYEMTELPNELKPSVYYINALRAFFLATRDWDDDKKSDFDFKSRTRGGEKDFALPDGSNGAGPLIYHAGG